MTSSLSLNGVWDGLALKHEENFLEYFRLQRQYAHPFDILMFSLH